MTLAYSETVHICFTEAERPLWFMRYLKKGFSHCFLLVHDKGDVFKYDFGHGVMRIDRLSSDDVQDIVKSCIIIEQEIISGKTGIVFTTCVGFIKALIGLKAPLVQTPYQLYKRLS